MRRHIFLLVLLLMGIILAAANAQWTATIKAERSNTTQSQTRTFGVAEGAIDGEDEFDEATPPAPPFPITLDTAFFIPADPFRLSKDIRGPANSITWEYNLRADAIGNPDGGTLSWVVSTVPANVSLTLTPQGEANINMREQNSIAFLAGNNITRVYTITATVSALPPTVTNISPSSGPIAGGTAVTITGTNFVAGATVTIGGVAATNVTVVSATQITATTPPRAAGSVDVRVQNPDGQFGTRAGGFTYDPPPPMVRLLAVNSDPIGVPISVSPADKDGNGDGIAPFTRQYNSGTIVTLTAPPTFGTKVFSHWEVDGENMGSNVSVTIAINPEHTATAHYIISTTITTTLLVVEGVIQNPDGSPAQAGLSVTVTVGGNSQTTLTEAGGKYTVTFFDPLGTVARSGDTVMVRVSYITGESAVSIVLTPQQISNQRVTVDVRCSGKPEFDLSVPKDIGLIHIPLKVTVVGTQTKTLNTVGDLYDALGVANVNFIITRDTVAGVWRSYLGPQSKGTLADRSITDDLGMITVMKTAVTLRLKGDALGTDGKSQITLKRGTNLVGVPLKNANLKRVSDLLSLTGIKDNATSIIVSDAGTFKVVTQPDDPGDISITGGQSFIITARAAGVAEITGVAWDNVSGSSSAAPPMVVVGHQVNESTPVLALHGAVIDEVTGARRNLAQDGFRVTVKNLSTGATFSTLSGSDTPDGYSLTVVDAPQVERSETPIYRGRAARVGDVPEITAESPSPLIGFQPLRHIVSTEDVKASQIRLPDLITYPIPKETKLLPNYPNPFNPETWVPFRLAKESFVTLSIYDVTGSVVRTLLVGHQPAAVYESKDKAIYWDGRNDFGERVASGVYFYTLTANDFTATRKMLILK